MSSQEVRGPVMLAATTMLRPPPARIAKLGDNFVLPRSIPLKSAAGGAAGLFIGIVIYFLFVVTIFGFMFETLFLVIGAFTAAGATIVNWSPLRGENWTTWATLKVGMASRGRVIIDGQEVRAYIGVAPLPYSAAGRVVVRPGAEEVLPGSVDERGASLTAAQIRQQRNLGGMGMGAGQATGSRPFPTSRPGRPGTGSSSPRNKGGRPTSPGSATPRWS